MGTNTSRPPAVRALETIYREHHHRVRWILRARGIDDAALDDLVHDVFLAIHRRLPQRDVGVPLSVWIAGVTRNVAFSHRRARARRDRDRRTYAQPSPDPLHGPDDEVAAREAWHALRQFIEELPAPQREVFVMVDVLGESIPTAAHTCEAGINTLTSRLRLARRRFADRFGGYGTSGPLMERAREGERPSARRSDRRLALLLADLRSPRLFAASGSTVAAVKVVGAIAMGSAVVALLGSFVAPASPARIAQPLAASARPHPIEAIQPERPSLRPVELAMVPAGAVEVPRAHEPSRAPASVRTDPTPREAATPATDSDALGREIAALRRARSELLAGQPKAALVRLDEAAADFPSGTFARERLVLELEAACALGRTERVTVAARRLQAIGAAIDPAHPCRDG